MIDKTVSHYRIIEKLGEGGMGEVYLAEDTKLHRRVALKFLPAHLTADREARERFEREAQAAAALNHPNIVTIYEINEFAGGTYMVMEYVEGSTLKDKIQSLGAPPVQQAVLDKLLPLGDVIDTTVQLCEGLARAHRAGIVHRDIKPGNILINKDGIIKILDFGIAKLKGVSKLTSELSTLGTVYYMSPEQTFGKEVDGRSDIWSVGVLLYEMLTGQLPFKGDYPQSVMYAIVNEEPEPVTALRSGVPMELEHIIQKALEKNRDERYQNIIDMVVDLRRAKKESGPELSAVKEKTKPELTLRIPRKFLFSGLAALLVALWAIFYFVFIGKRAVKIPYSFAGPCLAVLNFENKSGDTKLDSWRDMLSELLITSLSQSKYIRVISGEEMYTILKRLGIAEARKYSSEDIENIAVQTRATHVLRGSYLKAGESFIITAGLQKPGTGETSNPLRLEAGSEKDIIIKVDELTRQVKEGLNLSAAQIATDFEKEAGKITTSSPEALKYYIEGRRLHNKMEYEKSIAFMKNAVEIDPEFVMAYRSMAAAYGNLGHAAEGRKYLKKALELSDRLPENERLLIEGQTFLENENYAKEIEVLERLVKVYPGHLAGHDSLALAYANVKDFDKAIEHMEFEYQNRKTVRSVGNLAFFYRAKGFYQKAEDVCRSFLQDVEDNANVRQWLIRSYLCHKRFDLALAEAEKITFIDPSLKSEKGVVLFCKDDLAGAGKILGVDYNWNDAILLARGMINETFWFWPKQLIFKMLEGDKGKDVGTWGQMALVQEKNGRYREAYQAFAQYLKFSDEYRKSAPESGLPYLPSQQRSDLFTKGRIQAELKSFDEARKTAEELKLLIDKGINRKEIRYYEYILGLIELEKKNYRQAADFFSRACGRLDFEYGYDTDHALFFDPLARTLYEWGDLEKARQEYEKITLLTLGRFNYGDIYAKAYYMLGKIYARLGQKEKAIENYSKFADLWKDCDLQLRPMVEEAKEQVKKLGGK